jgi:hypothetical protein
MRLDFTVPDSYQTGALLTHETKLENTFPVPLLPHLVAGHRCGGALSDALGGAV